MEDDITNFVASVFKYLVDQEYKSGLLIKRHTGNFKTLGDFSFVNIVKSWHEFLNCCQQTDTNNNFLKYLNKNIDDLIKSSQSWPIVVTKCIEMNDRVHLFLDRPKVISIGLRNGILNNLYLTNTNVQHPCNYSVQIDPQCMNCTVTSLRVKYLANVIKNLCIVNSLNINKIVSSISRDKKDVFVGAVLNAKNNVKENTITANEFIRMRQDELTLIAQHKYGVRACLDNEWKQFITHLGESAAAFELLQTKSPSPVKICFDSSGGSSKGAAFILYNCARLETLVRTFNEKVSQGCYPPPPNEKTIDFSLLNDEDEWCLIFNYIMCMPSVLRSAAEHKEDRCEFRPHLICSFLSGMVKVFSQYYRRVRILTEPRKHLLSVLYARMYMLNVLNATLKSGLQILNIKSVTHM